MAVERVLSNLNLISFKTEGGLQNHIDELQDGDLVFTPDNSLKGNLFDFKWTDHKLNDISWLNADTFSWQSGDVYVAAFEHLVNDYISLSTGVLYAYYAEDAGETFYLRTDTPSVGDQLLDETGTPAYEAYGEHKVKEIYDDGSFARTATFPGNRFYRDTSKDITLSVPKSETETISGITIRYYKADDGHKICPPDQEANVQALYEATGVAWYYIIDMINKQFKLPRTKFGFTGLRDSVGGYVEAGLPNLFGEIYAGGNYGFSAFTSASGVFKTELHTGWRANTQQQEVSGASEQVEFDASRFNPVYGNSDTVQPKATQMHLYFYVGNFEREAIEQTAGLSAELFNGKADKATVDGQFESAKINYVPSGSVTAFAGTTAPTGWLKCDGSAISRTTYAKLFTAIGTKYGAGDGSTTFNLPTQSVLPLGTSSPVITGAEHTIDYTQSLTFRNQNGNKQTSTVGLGIEGSTGLLASISTSSTGLGASRYVPTNLYADLTKATGAKAIVCIKY